MDAKETGRMKSGVTEVKEGAGTDESSVRKVETVCNGNTRPIRWPVGAHAEARLGVAEFAKLVAGAHKLPMDIFERTKSRLTYEDCDGVRRLIRTTEGLRGALQVQKELLVSVELVLPKPQAQQGLEIVSERQQQLRQKLVARRPQRRVTTAQLEQWTMMDLRRDRWKSWKNTVCGLFETVPDLLESADVRYVVPPRSNEHGQQVYCLMPVVKPVRLFSFSVSGRRFAVMSDPDQANDARVCELLGAFQPPNAPERRGCTIPPGSQSVIAQDLTILLAMEPECIMAVRELNRGFADLNAAMADALLHPLSKWVHVCGLPVEEFVRKEETELEREALEAQALLLELEEQKKNPPSPTGKQKKQKSKQRKRGGRSAGQEGLAATESPISGVDGEDSSDEGVSPAQAEQASSADDAVTTTKGPDHTPRRVADQELLEIDPEVYAIAMAVPDADEEQGSDWQVVSKRRQHRQGTAGAASAAPDTAKQLSPRGQQQAPTQMEQAQPTAQTPQSPPQQPQQKQQEPKTPPRQEHNSDMNGKAGAPISETVNGPRLSPGAERKPAVQPAEQVLLFGTHDEHAVAAIASTANEGLEMAGPGGGTIYHSPAAMRLAPTSPVLPDFPPLQGAITEDVRQGQIQLIARQVQCAFVASTSMNGLFAGVFCWDTDTFTPEVRSALGSQVLLLRREFGDRCLFEVSDGSNVLCLGAHDREVQPDSPACGVCSARCYCRDDSRGVHRQPTTAGARGGARRSACDC